MAELEDIIKHLDARFTPIELQLAKLTEIQATLARLQEKDNHTEQSMERVDKALGKAFDEIRGNKLDVDVKIEIQRRDTEKMRAEFDLSRKKCDGVERAFSELETAFDRHEREYTAKKNIGYGMWLVIAALLFGMNWMAKEYYDTYKADKLANQQYRTAQDTANTERDEQLKLITQQIRNLHR